MSDCSRDVTITAAIIVKDEERCIARCLDNIVQLFDEIIIVDTGSTDNTIKIINRYYSEKIKTFQTAWHDNFSKARNMAIRKCTCRYIFFIDADEYLSITRNNLLDGAMKMDNSASQDHYANCPEVRDHNDNSSKTVRRCFAHNGIFYYSGYVHEEIRRRDGNKIENINIDVVVYHNGYEIDIIKSKDKLNGNNSLNLKNLHDEHGCLRWQFFCFRDHFENLKPACIYSSLSNVLKIRQNESQSINSLKSDDYTFAI